MTIVDFADFLKGDNLIFLLIVATIFLSAVWVVVIIIIKIFKALARMFGGSEKRPDFNQKEEQTPVKQEVVNMPRQKIMGGDFIKISPKTPDEQKPEQKTGIIPPKKDFSASAGLAKLKNENPEAEAKPGRYKFFQNSDTKEPSAVAERARQEKIAEGFNKSLGGLRGGEPSKETHETGVEKTGFFGNKVLDKKDEGGVPLAKKSSDASVFEGKNELTRRQLKYKLWKDPKVAKAAKESLLFLKPTERAKLEKELFPTVYGSNISKSDVRTRMHKLSRKMLSEQNPQAKALLRKEIKFAKKITGVK